LENVYIFYVHLEYLQTFGIFYDHLVHFVFLWYIFSGFGIMYREKSGNPGSTVWLPLSNGSNGTAAINEHAYVHTFVCRKSMNDQTDINEQHRGQFSTAWFAPRGELCPQG
jgi:hypothetical protein